MKLGETGLKVDYIVNKIKDEYPSMSSGELAGWSTDNSKYLVQYLRAKFPGAVQMINLSAIEVDCEGVAISSEGKLVRVDSVAQYYTNKDERLSTIRGNIVDTGLGNSYNEYPYKIYSIPVVKGKKYKIFVKINEDSGFIPFNDRNVSHKYSTELRYGFTRGRYLTINMELQQGGVFGTTTEKAQGYIGAASNINYNQKFTQRIKINKDYELNTFTGCSCIVTDISGTQYSVDTYVKLYDGYSNKVELKNNGTTTIIQCKEVVINTTTGSDHKFIVHNTKGSDSDSNKYAILSAGQVLTFKVEIDRSRESHLTSNEYESSIAITSSPLSFLSASYGGVTVNLDNIGDSPYTLPASTDITLDGKYIVNLSSSVNVSKKSINAYENYNLDSYIITNTLEEIPLQPSSSIEYNMIYVNDDPEGYNLIVQVPRGYRLFNVFEVNEDDDYSVDYESYEDIQVTPEYLDTILLDRTITKYSNSDDIYYLGELVGITNIDNMVKLGVYSDGLKSLIKSIQQNYMNRSYYITGWVDPETEYYLEVKYGIPRLS